MTMGIFNGNEMKALQLGHGYTNKGLDPTSSD